MILLKMLLFYISNVVILQDKIVTITVILRIDFGAGNKITGGAPWRKKVLQTRF
jgi:hypothetical protein